ncbi:MAG: MazG family protein, partial [Oscillospiraceae bacterium]
MVDFLTKENYTIKDLVDIMKILRSDKGCPWDKEQNHQTIRKDFIEETYEVLEAIDLADDELLQEELGDVLLQVVFHSQIEQESGGFSFDDVCDGICKKLIVRHPHVFGEVSVKNTGEVLKNWDNIKQETKNQKSCTQTLESVPKILPSLMRSAKVIKRAKRLPAYSESFGDANSLFAEFDEKADEFKSA